jgi:predicted lipoprotein with Yx(FWY)xxD motif
MMRTTVTLSALVVALAAATGLALGAGSSSDAPASPSTAAASTAAAGTMITAHGSRYGTVLFDGRGFAVYLFTRERGRIPACYGACAKAWPPVLTRGRARGARGARASLVGSVRRRDGSRQVTYRGHPLYYYVGDRRPGDILCQNVVEFGGTWLVVRPSGAAVH